MCKESVPPSLRTALNSKVTCPSLSKAGVAQKNLLSLVAKAESFTAFVTLSPSNTHIGGAAICSKHSLLIVTVMGVPPSILPYFGAINGADDN